MRIAIIGTSRLHRPLAKLLDRKVHTNFINGINGLFLRVGYLHTAAEAAQVLQYISGGSIPSSMWRYVFRKENPKTTPLNEFDTAIEASMREGTPIPYPHPDIYQTADCFVIEVSSLSQNIHIATGTAVHTNPNLEQDIPYKDIYPEGFYAKYRPALGITRIEADVDTHIAQFGVIKKLADSRPVIVLGHLTDGSNQFAGRARANDIIEAAAKETGIIYFDTKPFVQRHGFNSVDGITDVHHLPHTGEDDIGVHIQQAALRATRKELRT